MIVGRLGFPSMSAHYLKVLVNYGLSNRLGTERYSMSCGRGTNDSPYQITQVC